MNPALRASRVVFYVESDAAMRVFTIVSILFLFSALSSSVLAFLAIAFDMRSIRPPGTSSYLIETCLTTSPTCFYVDLTILSADLTASYTTSSFFSGFGYFSSITLWIFSFASSYFSSHAQGKNSAPSVHSHEPCSLKLAALAVNSMAAAPSSFDEKLAVCSLFYS